MRYLITLALLLGACTERPSPPDPAIAAMREADDAPCSEVPGATGAAVPANTASCSEFVWHTRRSGEPVTCLMLYCSYGVADQATGGPATLYCLPEAK